MVGPLSNILGIIIGIGLSYIFIFIIWYFLLLFPSKSKRINRLYLFCWNHVSENDKERLLRCLKDDFHIDWAENAKIYKSADNKTLRIIKNTNLAGIKIDKKKEKATLKNDIPHYLKVKKENGQLNIYRKINCFRYTCQKVCERMKHQLMPLVLMVFLTTILSGIVICWLKFSFTVEDPQIISVTIPFVFHFSTCAQDLTTIFILFYISFWIVYELRIIPQYFCDIFCPCGNNEQQRGSNKFCKSFLPFACKCLYTLGSRLDIISTTRKSSNEMQEKAKVTRTYGTFLFGFCAIFVTIIFTNLNNTDLSYGKLIVGLQLIALILLIIGVDSFDSCLNRFPQKELSYAWEYYKRGTRLFYISMQLITISLLIIAFSVDWRLTVSMVYLFLLFGYTYWFPGFKYKELGKELCECCQEKKSGYLFSTDAQYYLNSRYIPYELKEKFEYEGYPLSRNPKLTKRNENEWEIFDDVHDEKFIIKTEDGTKKVYREIIKK